MKVLAVKDIEEYGNVWLVHYTRQTAKGVVQGAVFMCYTLDAAKQKYAELQDGQVPIKLDTYSHLAVR